MARKRYYQSDRNPSYNENYTQGSEGRYDRGMNLETRRDRQYDENYADGRMPRKSYNEGYYEGPEARRTQEMEDGGMIREDRSQIANLPQGVKIQAYPKTGPWIPEMLDDTIRGVDNQMDDDDRLRNKTFSPHKF